MGQTNPDLARSAVDYTPVTGPSMNLYNNPDFSPSPNAWTLSGLDGLRFNLYGLEGVHTPRRLSEMFTRLFNMSIQAPIQSTRNLPISWLNRLLEAESLQAK